MHKDELWQEYGTTGLPLEGIGHPKASFGGICGAINVWFYHDTPSGREILFQKRSAIVDHNPNKWDSSAGGHINLDESPIEATVRESREEIGATVNPDKLVFVFSSQSFLYNFIAHIYLYEWTGSNEFSFDDTEVAEVRWVPVTDARDFIKNHVKSNLASLDWYWELLFLSLAHL